MKKLLLCASLLVSGVALADESKSDGCSEQEQKTNVADMESHYKLCSFYLAGESLQRFKSNIEKSKLADQKICKVSPTQQTPTDSDFSKNTIFQIYQKVKSYTDTHNGSLPVPKTGNNNNIINDCNQYEEFVNKIVVSQNPPPVSTLTPTERKAKSIFEGSPYTPKDQYCTMIAREINSNQRFYKMAYHGQMTVAMADEYAHGGMSNFLGDNVTLDILIPATQKAKAEIFKGHDSQDEMLKFTNSLYDSCEKNYDTFSQGYDRDRIIDYSKRK